MDSNTIIEFFSNLPTVLIIFLFVYIAILYTIGVYRGQEVSFWPPKISAIQKLSNNDKNNYFEHSIITPSIGTPDSELLTPIISSTIETVCRAVCLPGTPDQASIRAFIFQKKGDKLVCTHFWAQNPVVEEVGITMFDLTDEAAKDVAVVKAFKTKATFRASIEPNPHGTHGNIDQKVSYVLATPILNKDKTVWGCVDFDASNETGVLLLKSNITDSLMLNLARLLSYVFESYDYENKLN